MGEGIRTERIIIKGRPALLKICPSSSKKCARLLANEKNTLLLAGKHVKVPSVLAYGRKKVGRAHHTYLLLEPLRGAPFVPARDYLHAAHYLGALHSRTLGKQGEAQIHGDAAAYLLSQSEPLAQQLRKSKATAPSVRRIALSLFAAAKRGARKAGRRTARHLSLNNTHLASQNWAKTQHGLALHGWFRAIHSSPALDIALFLSPFSLSWGRVSHLSEEAQGAFFGAYLARFGADAQEEIIAERTRLALPASAYLLLHALTGEKSSSGRHFSNRFFLKKACREAAMPLTPE